MTPPADLSVVVVLPTYNNAGTLPAILAQVEELGQAVIVVDDGSTDATPQALTKWLGQEHRVPVETLRHPANRGKAAALRTAFSHAAQRGFTHAATIDTDGQHDVEETRRLIAQAYQHPQALVLGVRQGGATVAPGRHRLGRTVSDWLAGKAAGRPLADSQCGQRVYPLHVIAALPCRAGRYAYETEILILAARRGLPLIEEPVTTRYLPPGQRVSHFRPVLDSSRWLLVMLRLIVTSSRNRASGSEAAHLSR